jgi:hypothetical protein
MPDSRELNEVFGQQIAEYRPSLTGDAAPEGPPADVGPAAASTP